MEVMRQIEDIVSSLTAGLDLRDAALGLVVIFLTAYATNYFFHRANLKLAKRNETLDRLNRQLGVLYGPLRMLRYAGETGFFFAHVSTLEAVIAQWEQGNFKDFKSGIHYPVEFNKHIEESYKKLLRARKGASRS